MTTPYEVLGVSPDATEDEIKAAYRRACMTHHPDRGGDAAAFQAVTEAFAALQHRGCPDCGGKGFITTRRGFFVVKDECPRCWKKP